MFVKNKHIYFVLVIKIILINILACSNNKFQIVESNRNNLSYKRGDQIIIVMINNKKLECIFLRNTEEAVVVAIPNEAISKEVFIKLGSIYRIYKRDDETIKQPSPYVKIGLILAIIGLILYIGYNSDFPP